METFPDGPITKQILECELVSRHANGRGGEVPTLFFFLRLLLLLFLQHFLVLCLFLALADLMDRHEYCDSATAAVL